MGAMQTTNKHRKRSRASTSTDQARYKRTDRFRTTMRSATLRALVTRNYPNSKSSSSYESIMNNNSLTIPTTITTVNSQFSDGNDPYLSDFDYRKLSTLTGLAETKINELHREFLILSDHGRLSFEKYKSMLETIADQKNFKQLDQLAQQTFQLFDKDGNNFLDFTEFIAAYISMEKNELHLSENIQPNKHSPVSPSTHPQRPTLTSVTRQAMTYYSPPRTLVNTSPILSSRTAYLPTNYTAYYYPAKASQRYVYKSSQYSYR